MPAEVPRMGAVGWGARDWLIRGCLCMWGVLQVEMVPISGPGAVQVLSSLQQYSAQRRLAVGDFSL